MRIIMRSHPRSLIVLGKTDIEPFNCHVRLISPPSASRKPLGPQGNLTSAFSSP